MAETGKPIRWWPAVIVVVIAVVLLGVTWFGKIDVLEQIYEIKVALTVLVFLLSTLALAIWLAFFSRVPVKHRLMVFGIFFAAVTAFLFLFRYRGISGDLVPQFAFRFGAGTSDLIVGTQGDMTGVMDYSQFLGPHRNGIVTGVSLARDWEASPPRVVWRRPVGIAWSGTAISQGAAVTQEQHGEEEQVVSYDLGSGKVNWIVREKALYSNPMSGSGPRATPTISEGRVIAMGGTGILKSIDLETGETLWMRDVMKDNDTEVPLYGVSSSPLVIDGLVVVNAGGKEGRSLVAYDADRGEIVWSGGDDPMAYSSPLVTELAGVRQVVSLNHNSVTGHDPATGRVLWRQEWPDSQSNVPQPIPIDGDRLLVSAGWGQGAKLYQIRVDGTGLFSTELLWESIRFKPKFANSVYYDGFVYGLDDGIMVCLDPEDGSRRWKRGRYGHGQVLLVGDLLLIQTEHGEIVLVEPTPEEHRELTRFRVMDEKIWNTPALAGPYLFVRNDREAVLVELPVN